MNVTARLVALESRRVVTSIWLFVGLVLSGLYLYRLLDGYPVVLHRDSIYIANSLAPLSICGYLAGHGASSLAYRSGADDLLGTMPTDHRQRAIAELVAGLSVGGVALVFCAAAVIVMRAVGATGLPAIGELLAGVAAVAVATVAGVAVGHRFGTVSSVIVPIAIVVGLTIAIAGRGRMRWLNLFVDMPSRAEVIELARRVPWAHLAYLCSIGIVCALTVIGGRRVALVASAAVLAAAMLGWYQLRPATAADEALASAYVTSYEHHRCEPAGDVIVCLLPGFGGWRDEINDELDRVFHTIAPREHPTRLVLAQRADSIPHEGYRASYVTRATVEIAGRVGEDVPIPKDRPLDASALTSVAAWRVGLPATATSSFLPNSTSDEPTRGPDVYCSRPDGLAVAVAYLAVADSGYASELRVQSKTPVSEDGSAVSQVFVGGVELSAEQAQLLGQMLSLPNYEEVGARVGELLADDVLVADLRTAAGLRPPNEVATYPDWVEAPPPCRS